MQIPVSVQASYNMADVKALVDSGATNNFMHPNFAKQMKIGQRELDKPKNIYNIDNTTNKAGQITHYLNLAVTTGGKTKEMRFLITDIGWEDVLLGYPWLSTYEPRFSWKHGTIDESNLPIVLRTINPHDRREVIVRYLSTDERENIVAELEHEVGGEPPAIRNTLVKLAVDAQQYTKKVEIPQVYKAFAKVFSEEESQRFPPRRTCNHTIEFKPGTPDAIDCKIYPMTRTEDEALDLFIDEQLEKGYIRPSKSQYASSFFFIKKKDRKLRPIQDYRKINTWTVRNQYPLPLIGDLIHNLSGAVVFTKFDVRQGYNNICIKEGDEHKATFKTRRGLFKPMVMYFGLCNSPATFQAFMNDIYCPTIAKHDLLGTAIRVYTDNIAIATKVSLSPSAAMAAHTAAVTNMLKVALAHDLYFKPEKCVFHASSIDYLWVILEKGVTRMDPVKISSINDWPRPKTVKDICSFLGFCNFYRPFIRGFANVAHPLNELTRKDTPWLWSDRQQQAFTTLKHRVTSKPILAQPVLNDQFNLEVDASGFAIGAVLLQKKEDRKRHPMGYYSATLNEAERNYDIYNLELLAIIKALRNWQPLLAGSPHDIRVFSDHMNLQYWCDPQKISRRVACKFLELQEFPIKIHHVKGKSNGRANALSQRPDYNQGEQDNANVTVLPDQLFVRALVEIGMEHDKQDEQVLRKWVDTHKLKKIDGIWYKNGRRVITNIGSGTQAVIAAHHDAPVHGHPGIARTIQLIE
jgi:hypothetical protein